MLEDTRNEFKDHTLNESGIEKAMAIAEAFSDILIKVEILGVSSRELSIVKTKLQEACFFAKRSIAEDPSNQLV